MDDNGWMIGILIALLVRYTQKPHRWACMWTAAAEPSRTLYPLPQEFISDALIIGPVRTSLTTRHLSKIDPTSR
jgi:hypothetical protein